MAGEEKPLAFLPVVMSEMHHWPWSPLQNLFFYPGFSFEIPQTHPSTYVWLQTNAGQ
jgi:hypothetical protein